MADCSVSFGSQTTSSAGGYHPRKLGGPGQTTKGDGVKFGQGQQLISTQSQGVQNPFAVVGMQPQTGIQQYSKDKSFVDSGQLNISV